MLRSQNPYHNAKLDTNKENKLTNATKKRATTFPDLISGDCIQVFLIAIRSAKWFAAERIPINR